MPKLGPPNEAVHFADDYTARNGFACHTVNKYDRLYVTWSTLWINVDCVPCLATPH